MKESKKQKPVPDVSFRTGAQAEADEEMEDHLAYLEYQERLKKKEQEKTSSQSKEQEIKSKQSMPGKKKASKGKSRPMPRGAKKAKPKK